MSYSKQNVLWSSPHGSVQRCSIASDNLFSPVSDCRLDFTLFFEQCFLSTLPSLFLLLATPGRLYSLYRRVEKTTKNLFGIWKLVLSILLVLVQLALLVLWSLSPFSRTAASVPSTALNLIASIETVALSQLEHSRSVRPSSLLNIYLLFSIFLDCAQARTLYVSQGNVAISILFFVTLSVKLVLLLLEAQSKRSYLKPKYQSLPPEARSGIINQSFLWWLNGLFAKGSRTLITFRDLYELDPDIATEHVGDNLKAEWERRSRPESQFSLVFAMWRSLRRPYALVILPRLCLIGFTFAQPFLIARVLSLVEGPVNEASRYEGYILTAVAGLTYVGIAVSSLHSSHNLFRFITIFRGATISLIYNRALFLADGGYEESAAVALMSNDVDQIAFGLEELNECWSRSIEIAIGLPLLTRQLGWVSVIPLLVVALATAGASQITRIIGRYQKSWADATQRRIATTSSMLNEMKNIKMMGLSGIVSGIVQAERVNETKKQESWSWVIVWKNVIANAPVLLGPAATFAVYGIQAMTQGSDYLDTTRAFTSLALIALISHPASRLLCAIPNVAASLGCFSRIQDFLLAESRVDQRSLSKTVQDRPIVQLSVHTNGAPAHVMIMVEKANIKPARDSQVVLHNIDLTITEGSIVMVTGAVGTGKSTLLRAMLGELICDHGSIVVNSRQIGYCSQIPWLPSGTIQEAICGFTEDNVDEKWYKNVLEACALSHDIAQFPARDHTTIGSRGITLSGGQKQRISLARALYRRPSIFLLDDILSALDKRTEKEIIDRLFGKGGLFHQLRSTVVLVTHAVQYLSLADQVVVISALDGTIKQVPHKDINSLESADIPAQQEPVTGVAQVELIEGVKGNAPSVVALDEARDLARQTGDLEVYKYYFKSIGFVKIFIFIFFVVIHVFASSFSQIWLKWWTDIDGHQIGFYTSVYFLLAFLYCLGNGGYAWAIAVLIGPSTGRKLHRVLLHTVMRAPQSFFTVTQTGTILNRFTHDMSLIQGQLSTGVLATVSNLVSSLAEGALVALGSTYIAATVPFFMLAIYFLQRIYLRTSRQLRFLDLESRSPVYSHFLETLDGLVTIRAFGWEDRSAKVTAQLLDHSQKPYYTLYCIQRWLALVLDLMVAAMAIIVVGLATTQRQSTSSGYLGISMNNVLSFNLSLSAFVRGWTMFETSLGAIARLRDFEAETAVEEKAGENKLPPEDWPSRGLIEIENLSASYDYSRTVLRNISLKIVPGQKVGICGRTGSGKSSLLSTILRVLDYSDGTIKIDNHDLSKIPRDIIRSRLITLPQDALYLTGTVRLNVDPFNHNTDEQIISALTKVRLWSVLFERGGLSADLQVDSLSKGQRQLLALARAILQRSSILLLDEATSSVDGGTDQILQAVIKQEFHSYTVITVAHRLETIVGADVVVVMDAGEIVELGKPRDLMGMRGSAFSKLLKVTKSNKA